MNVKHGQGFELPPCLRGMATVVCVMAAHDFTSRGRKAHGVALAGLAAALATNCQRWSLPRLMVPVTGRMDYLIGRTRLHHDTVITAVVDGREEAVSVLRADLARVMAQVAELGARLQPPEAGDPAVPPPPRSSYDPPVPPITPSDGN